MTEEEKKAFEEAKAEAAKAKAEAAAMAKARAEADAAMAKAREDAASLEQRLNQIEKEKRDAEMRALEPMERVSREVQELSTQLQHSRAQSAAEAAALRHQIRATELVAYRERALRAVGDDIIHEMVGGNSEQEIDQSIDMARSEFARVSERVRAKAEADIAARYAAQGGQPPAQQYVPVYQAPPANPHFVQQGSVAPGAGFPTPTNPLPPTEASPGDDVRELTSEEAVRSGRYGGEIRERMLKQIKQGGAQAMQMGSLPRHFVHQNHTQMPGGVQQPQGLQTPPVAHPQHTQQQGAPANPR